MLKIMKISAATMLALGVCTASAAEDGRFIVKYKDQTSANNVTTVASQAIIHSAIQAAGGTVVLPLSALGATAFTGSNASVNALRANPNVEYVEIDAKRYPQSIFNDSPGDPNAVQVTPYAIVQSEADQVTLSMANAKTVCVIDAGIALGTGEIGGLNADFDGNNITGTNDPGTGNWFEDGGFHGTHVSGTVAAVDNGFGVIGMAPGNPLHIIKVFNADGWGFSSTLAKAATDCTAGGADIITMSLGGGGANTTEENAFIAFTDAGGLVAAAAGNAGNSSRLFPASYKSIMMIAANDADNNIASFSQFPSCRFRGTTDDGHCVELSAGGVATLSTYPAGSASLATLTADGAGFASSAMENIGTAAGDTFDFGLGEATDPGAAGKICVISRGDITFHDKVQNCELSGGIGAIIFNNVAGMLFGTLGSPNLTTIPTVGTTMADGPALLASSSAAISVGPSDYGFSNGTSMATPAVSGVAALVWSNHPTCTGADIRNALKASAEDQGAPGKDVNFGFGIVKAKAANDYLTANGCAGL